jgi:hypothetical protein
VAGDRCKIRHTAVAARSVLLIFFVGFDPYRNIHFQPPTASTKEASSITEGAPILRKLTFNDKLLVNSVWYVENPS